MRYPIARIPQIARELLSKPVLKSSSQRKAPIRMPHIL